METQKAEEEVERSEFSLVWKKKRVCDDLLPKDVWKFIGLKLGASDRIRFGAVSKSWMSLLPSRQPPCLLLADSQEEKDEDKPLRGFVCMGEEKIYDFHVPDLYKAICVGSTGNWLVTAHRDDDTIRLINPFSKQQQLYLPSLSKFEYKVKMLSGFKHIHLWKVVLSSSPSNGHGRDCVAMAIFNFRKILAMAKLGDTKWTTLQIGDLPFGQVGGVEDGVVIFGQAGGVEDVVFYKGQFYAITDRLLVCDIGDAPKATYISECFECFKNRSMWQVRYLVEWLDELLLVIKRIHKLNGGTDYRTSIFHVYKFDFVDRKWNEVKCLGEHSLFLGSNTSVSVRASDYFGLIRKNCIYFTDDFTLGYQGNAKDGGHDMGVFDLEDNSITPHYRGVSTSFYSPPLWIVPN